VRHILEGSVRKAGDTIRITAQLIDAKTDKHLWSQTFDRTMTTESIFAIQDEITKAIVGQLSSRIGASAPIAAPAARSADTENADAYALFLEGQARFVLRGQENIIRSMSALEHAVEIDPGFARAWAVLSADYSIAPGWLSGKDLARDFPTLADGAARKAIALDPSLSLPYAVLGARSANIMDYEAAFSNFDKAIERNPRDENIYKTRGEVWNDLGFFERALADYERCLALNPDFYVCRDNKSNAQILAGDVNGGLAALKDNLRRGFGESFNAAQWGAYLSRGDEVGFLYEINNLASFLGPGDTRWAVDMMFQAQTNPAYDRKEALRIFEARLEGMGAKLVPRSFAETSVLFLFGAYDRLHPIAFNWWWATTGFPEWAKSPERKRLMRERKLDAYWRKHGFPPQCHAVGVDDFACD
jgi:tetratricopeptide (TPR) repeat protein